MASIHFKIFEGSCGIPTDVTFQIVEKSGRKKRLYEVNAHKMILAMVSDTFKTMFYVTDVGDKTASVVKIEKTTATAFRIMVDAVYNVKSVGESLKGKSVHEVFDVVNLIERYQIVALMEAVKEHLANYPVTDDTLLEVAGDAKEYINMFEAEAQLLLRTCAKFLKAKLKDVDDVSRYAAEHEDQGKAEVLATLLARMKDIVPSECSNCKKEVCQDGEGVKEDEFREGLLVTNNIDNLGWQSGGQKYDRGTGRITKVEGPSKVEGPVVVVEFVKEGVTQNGVIGSYFTGDRHGKKYNNTGSLNFLFRCK